MCLGQQQARVITTAAFSSRRWKEAGEVEEDLGNSVHSGIWREIKAPQDQQGDGEKARQIPEDGKTNALESGRVWQQAAQHKDKWNIYQV